MSIRTSTFNQIEYSTRASGEWTSEREGKRESERECICYDEKRSDRRNYILSKWFGVKLLKLWPIRMHDLPLHVNPTKILRMDLIEPLELLAKHVLTLSPKHTHTHMEQIESKYHFVVPCTPCACVSNNIYCYHFTGIDSIRIWQTVSSAYHINGLMDSTT